MRVLALADSGTAVFRGIHQFVSEAKRHGLLAAVTSSLDDPAHGQCLAASRANFNRDLVGGTTNTARLHFDNRLDVVQRTRQHVDRLGALLPGLLADTVQSAVNDALSRRLLAALHDDVHELGQHVVVEFRVRQNGADRSLGSTRHMEPSLRAYGPNFPRGSRCARTANILHFLGRFAPYLERDCLRSPTPAQSSVPRTVW